MVPYLLKQNDRHICRCAETEFKYWKLSFQEKDDLEARFRELNDTAERASSLQSTLQQELERTRQQANDALRAMDAERQQLRSANNK